MTQHTLFWITYFSLVNLISLSLYGIDKYKSLRGGLRRQTENSLFLIDFLGGWPFGLISQFIFKHKTSKRSFRVVHSIVIVTSVGIMAFLINQHPYTVHTIADTFLAIFNWVISVFKV